MYVYLYVPRQTVKNVGEEDKKDGEEEERGKPNKEK